MPILNWEGGYRYLFNTDTDQDLGIADTQDEDDDNDGIYDVIEKCPASAPSDRRMTT